MAEQVSIGTFASRTEADVVQGLLESAGIPAWVASDDAGGAYPVGFSGGARVMVGASDRGAAEQVLADIG